MLLLYICSGNSYIAWKGTSAVGEDPGQGSSLGPCMGDWELDMSFRVLNPVRQKGDVWQWRKELRNPTIRVGQRLWFGYERLAGARVCQITHLYICLRAIRPSQVAASLLLYVYDKINP